MNDKDNNIKYVKLGEVCKIITGKTPSTRNKEYWDNENGYNWLTIRDITNNNVSTERKITKKAIEECNLPITSSHKSLLFCFIATMKIRMLNKGYAYNQNICELIPNKKVLSKEYLMYYLQTKIDYLGRSHNKSVFSCLSKKIISEIETPLLPIQKQNYIVTRINYLKIDLNKIKSILSKLLLFKSKLLNYAFYNVEGSKKELKDIINIYGSKSTLTKEYLNNNPGKYPVYSSATKNKGLYGYIDTYMYDGEYGSFTKDGVHAGTLFYRNGKFNLYKSLGWNIKDNKLAMFNYVFLYFKWKELDIKKKCISGSMIEMFSKNLFLLYEIMIPSLDKQKIIANNTFKFYFKLKGLENKFNNLINKYDKLHKKIAMLIIQKEINNI